MVGDDRPAEPPAVSRSDDGDPFGALRAGARVGKYEIAAMLGQGGFGITYRARDSQLDRDVAIKEYLPTAFARRQGGSTVVPRSTHTAEDFLWGRARFLDEAKTLARLEDAPGIVNVYDFMEANGTAYMVMALVRGETLEARLKRDRRLTQPAIELLLYPLLDGLDVVHDAGFLHRDIKPANILIDNGGRPTLIDFGASRLALQGRTQAMTAVYTPGYAAPEQMTPSGRQGPWTDIYALAGTLHHCVTGQTPVSAIERLTGDAMVPASEAGKGRYGPTLLAAIDLGLKLKATERPQSITDWRRALSGIPAERAAGAPDAPTREQDDPTRPMDGEVTRRVAAGAPRVRSIWIVAGVVALMAAGGAAWMTLRPAPESREETARRAEEEGKRQIALAAKLRQEEEARQRAAAEATRKAEQEAARKAAEEKAATDAAARRQTEEAERQRFAAAEARRKADEEVARKAAAEKAATEEVTKRKAEEEAATRAAAEAARRRAEEQAHVEAEAKRKAEQEAAARKAAEEKAAAEATRRQAEEQARAEAEAKRKAEQEAATRKAAEEKAAADAAAKRAAEEQARAKAEAEATRRRAEDQARAEAEEKRKAAQESAARKAAEEKAAAEAAARQGEEDARLKAEAARRDEEARRAAEEKARAEAAVREKAEAESRAKAEEEARRKAEDEARKAAEDKAKADADARRQAEAAEAALRLSEQDRKRVQVALTSVGHDTRGSDGVFGPRTRQMITAWQKKQGAPETGYLTAVQLAALRQQAAPAIAKYDEDQRKLDEDKRKAEEDAKKKVEQQAPAPQAAAAPPATPGGPLDGSWSGGVDCAGFTKVQFRIQMSGGRGTFSNKFVQVSVTIQGDRATASVQFRGESGGREALAHFSSKVEEWGFLAKGSVIGGSGPCSLSLAPP